MGWLVLSSSLLRLFLRKRTSGNFYCCSRYAVVLNMGVAVCETATLLFALFPSHLN